MKIQILSDLHTEFGPRIWPRVDADVVLLAGDIGKGLQGLEYARTTFPGRPVLYIAGRSGADIRLYVEGGGGCLFCMGGTPDANRVLAERRPNRRSRWLRLDLQHDGRIASTEMPRSTGVECPHCG